MGAWTNVYTADPVRYDFRFEEGATIIEQGTIGTDFFVIKAGEVGGYSRAPQAPKLHLPAVLTHPLTRTHTNVQTHKTHTYPETHPGARTHAHTHTHTHGTQMRIHACEHSQTSIFKRGGIGLLAHTLRC
jgi:hypothetical protein